MTGPVGDERAVVQLLVKAFAQVSRPRTEDAFVLSDQFSELTVQGPGVAAGRQAGARLPG